MFAVFNEWLDTTHSHRLRRLAWAAPRFSSFNAALIRSLDERYGEVPEEALHVCGYLDNGRIRVCRCQAPPLLQQLWYNRKYQHNAGLQAFEGLDGVIYDAFTDQVGRHNDQGFFAASHFDDQMELALELLGEGIPFKAYTDRGFTSTPCVQAAYHGPAEVTAAEGHTNWLMEPERVANEWGIGKVWARCPLLKRNHRG